MKLRNDSRLTTTPLYKYIDDVDGTIYFFGLPRRVELLDEDEYTIHSLSEGEQLWQVADRFWGNFHLWWILAHVNDIVYPWDLTVGQDVKVPSKAALARMLQ